MWFKAYVSILIFFVDDLSICVSGVLKSPSIIFLLLISRFMVVCIFLMYVGAPVLDACVLLLQYLLAGLISLSLRTLIICQNVYNYFKWEKKFKLYIWYEHNIKISIGKKTGKYTKWLLLKNKTILSTFLHFLIFKITNHTLLLWRKNKLYYIF